MSGTPRNSAIAGSEGNAKGRLIGYARVGEEGRCCKMSA